MKIDMAKEELETKTLAFEKRLNTLIRDFVGVYKKLASDFTTYKTYSLKEIEVLDEIAIKREKQVERKNDEVRQYKLAL
jgi:hypothetical protein